MLYTIVGENDHNFYSRGIDRDDKGSSVNVIFKGIWISIDKQTLRLMGSTSFIKLCKWQTDMDKYFCAKKIVDLNFSCYDTFRVSSFYFGQNIPFENQS